jgi:hypothetical protein
MALVSFHLGDDSFQTDNLDNMAPFVAGNKQLIPTRLVLWDAFKDEVVEAVGSSERPALYAEFHEG